VTALPLSELGRCLGRWAERGAETEPKTTTVWLRKWQAYIK